jgi:hypothetical protein
LPLLAQSLEDNEPAPPGNNMPQVPGFEILIADVRTAQAVPIAPVIDQIALHPFEQDK